MGTNKQTSIKKSAKQEALAAIIHARSFLAGIINDKMVSSSREQITGEPMRKLSLDQKSITNSKSNDALIRDIIVIWNLLSLFQQIVSELNDDKKLTAKSLILKATRKAPQLIKTLTQAGDKALKEVATIALTTLGQAKELNQQQQMTFAPLRQQFSDEKSPLTGNAFSEKVVQHAQKTYEQFNNAYQNGGVQSISGVYSGIQTLLSLKELLSNSPDSLTEDALKSLLGVIPLLHQLFVVLDDIEEKIGLLQGTLSADLTKIAKSILQLLPDNLIQSEDNAQSPFSNFREQARALREQEIDELIEPLALDKVTLQAKIDSNNKVTGFKKIKAKATNVILQNRLAKLDRKLLPLLRKKENIASRLYKPLAELKTNAVSTNNQTEQLSSDTQSILEQFSSLAFKLIVCLEKFLVDFKAFLIEVAYPKTLKHFQDLRESAQNNLGYDSSKSILAGLQGHSQSPRDLESPSSEQTSQTIIQRDKREPSPAVLENNPPCSGPGEDTAHEKSFKI